MFSGNQIILQPDYNKLLRLIISEYPNKSEYDNDSNNFFNNINIIFYSKNLPDSSYSMVNMNGKYYVSMTIEEMRSIIKKCYDANPFTDELLRGVIKYLPSLFFDDIGVSFNKRNNINISNQYFAPDNSTDAIILDDLRSINEFIRKWIEELYVYELRDLIKLTIRINASQITVDKICDITNNRSYSKFLLKDNKEIVFDNFTLNKSLAEINRDRQNKIRTLYNSTKNESFLSNDVMYKFFITRSLNDWMDIIEVTDIFKNIKNVLRLYPYIQLLLQ